MICHARSDYWCIPGNILSLLLTNVHPRGAQKHCSQPDMQQVKNIFYLLLTDDELKNFPTGDLNITEVDLGEVQPFRNAG